MRVHCRGLTKEFGRTRAVDSLSFDLEPGQVTGFLGPNGSGKSTTMRMMLGLDHGAGSTLFDGKPLDAYPRAAAVVGAHLDAKFFHPKRTARNHLRMLAAASAVPKNLVDEVLELVGLSDVADKVARGFSLGMGQRLGLAGAILAQPQVLMLDEPCTNLDEDGVRLYQELIEEHTGHRLVLVASNDKREYSFCTQHIRMRGGVVQSGSSF